MYSNAEYVQGLVDSFHANPDDYVRGNSLKCLYNLYKRDNSINVINIFIKSALSDQSDYVKYIARDCLSDISKENNNYLDISHILTLINILNNSHSENNKSLASKLIHNIKEYFSQSELSGSGMINELLNR